MSIMSLNTRKGVNCMKRVLAILLVTVLLLCGCSYKEGLEQVDYSKQEPFEETGKSFGEPNQVYMVYNDAPTGWEDRQTAFIVNGKGEILLSGNTGEIGIVYNESETETPIYLWTAKLPDMDAGESQYWEKESNRSFQLCSLEGNPITDEINGQFLSVFGDLIIYGSFVPDNTNSQIPVEYIQRVMNIKTGENIMDCGYHQIADEFILLNRINEGYIILDKSGKIINESDKGTVNIVGFDSNLIMVRDDEDTDIYNKLTNIYGEKIFDQPFMGAGHGGMEDYLIIYRNDMYGNQEGQPFDLNTGEFVQGFEGKNVSYYNGETAIVDVDASHQALTDRKGNIISETYDRIWGCEEFGEKNESRLFCSANDEGDRTYSSLLNHKGEVIWSAKESGYINYNSKSEKFLFVPMENQLGAQVFDINGDLRFNIKNLSNIPKQIESVSFEWQSGLLNITHSYKNIYLNNIYDLEGNEIITNARRVHGLGDGLFMVNKGFESGIVNQNGEWVYKVSAFSSIDYD